jgi:biopolymer transport protein ExbD
VGLKKRNKVSAQFNMSSLTDIIFLLLIFFMLTSSLVAPNALNLKLPGSSKTSRVATDQIDNVTISRTGEYFFNGRRISINDLETTLGRKARASSKKDEHDYLPGSRSAYRVCRGGHGYRHAL